MIVDSCATQCHSCPFAFWRSRPRLPARTRVSYELKFERPNSHLLDVTMHADSLSGASVDFAIPDWAPGSYYIENYAANVQRFRAHAASGQELSWRKTDSQTWRIDLAGAKSITVEYQVYANTLQNNIAQYNERHAFIGGPSVWMYIVGAKDRPTTLSDCGPQRLARRHRHGPHLRHDISGAKLRHVRRLPPRDFRFRRKRFRSPRNQISRDRARRDGPEGFHQVRGRSAKSGGQRSFRCSSRSPAPPARPRPSRTTISFITSGRRPAAAWNI